MDNKMSSFPWRVEKGLQIVSSVGAPICDLPFYETKDFIGRTDADKWGIINAVNSTYGKGINPEAVGDLLDALKDADSYIKMYPALSTKIKAAIEKSKLIK